MLLRLSIQLALGFFLIQCVNFALDDLFLIGVCQYVQYLYDKKQAELESQENNGLLGIRKKLKKEIKGYVGMPQNISNIRNLSVCVLNVVAGLLLIVYFAYIFVRMWNRCLDIVSKRDKKKNNVVAFTYKICCKKYKFSIFAVVTVLINFCLIVVLFFLRENANNVFDINSVYLFQFHSQYHQIAGKSQLNTSKHLLNHLNINHSLSKLLIYFYTNITSLNWAIFSLFVVVILTIVSLLLNIFSQV